MATIYELKRRAQELSAKKDSLSISPDEVGGLIDETLDVINEAEKNQVGTGYPQYIYDRCEDERGQYFPGWL